MTIAASNRKHTTAKGIIAAYLRRLSTTGTIVALVVRAAGSTLVVYLRKRRHLMWLLLPLTEPLVSMMQILHSRLYDCKGTTIIPFLQTYKRKTHDLKREG